MTSNNTHCTAGNFTYMAQPADPAPQRPTLLFLHGSGHSAAFWSRQLSALSNRFNCIALDLPGHGHSTAAVCTSVADCAAAVCDFVKVLDTQHRVTGPIIPVGLSLGGAIVQWLLIHHPERYSAAVIVNSGARLKVAPLIFEALEKDYAAYLELLYMTALSPAHQQDTEIETLLKQCTTDDAAVTTADFRCCDPFDVMAELGKIDCPTLVIAAEEDQLTPVKYGDFLTNAIPGARQVTLSNAGHFSPLEQPAAFNAAVSEFIESLPTS